MSIDTVNDILCHICVLIPSFLVNLNCLQKYVIWPQLIFWTSSVQPESSSYCMFCDIGLTVFNEYGMIDALNL